MEKSKNFSNLTLTSNNFFQAKKILNEQSNRKNRSKIWHYAKELKVKKQF